MLRSLPDVRLIGRIEEAYARTGLPTWDVWHRALPPRLPAESLSVHEIARPVDVADRAYRVLREQRTGQDATVSPPAVSAKCGADGEHSRVLVHGTLDKVTGGGRVPPPRTVPIPGRELLHERTLHERHTTLSLHIFCRRCKLARRRIRSDICCLNYSTLRRTSHP